MMLTLAVGTSSARTSASVCRDTAETDSPATVSLRSTSMQSEWCSDDDDDDDEARDCALLRCGRMRSGQQTL